MNGSSRPPNLEVGLRTALATALGDSSVAGEHDDDAVGFAEFLGAEDEAASRQVRGSLTGVSVLGTCSVGIG